MISSSSAFLLALAAGAPLARATIHWGKPEARDWLLQLDTAHYGVEAGAAVSFCADWRQACIDLVGPLNLSANHNLECDVSSTTDEVHTICAGRYKANGDQSGVGASLDFTALLLAQNRVSCHAISLPQTPCEAYGAGEAGVGISASAVLSIGGGDVSAGIGGSVGFGGDADVSASAGGDFGVSAGADGGASASAGADFGASASAGVDLGLSAGVDVGASAGVDLGASAGVSGGLGASFGVGATASADLNASATGGVDGSASASAGADVEGGADCSGGDSGNDDDVSASLQVSASESAIESAPVGSSAPVVSAVSSTFPVQSESVGQSVSTTEDGESSFGSVVKSSSAFEQISSQASITSSPVSSSVPSTYSETVIPDSGATKIGSGLLGLAALAAFTLF